MAENNEVNAFHVIELIVEHLNDKAHLEYCYRNEASKMETSYAGQEVTQSFKMLEAKLNAYVDQRIMKKLKDLNLIYDIKLD